MDKMLRAQYIKKCVVHSVAQESGKLPAHIVVAFAGTQEYCEVITEQTAHCYVIKIRYSPSHTITTELFIELANAQIHKDVLWSR